MPHHIRPPSTGTTSRRGAGTRLFSISLSPSLPIYRPFLSQFSIFAPKLLSSGSGDARLGLTVKNPPKSIHIQKIVKLTDDTYAYRNLTDFEYEGHAVT